MSWRWEFSTLVVVAMLGSWAAAGWAAGPVSRHSGTVMAVSKADGTIELGEVGPWRLKDGKTEVTRRVIGVSGATEFARVTRAAAAAPSGWVGDFVESRLEARDIRPGDFVTVTVTREGRRLMAVKVTVVEIAGR